MQRANTGLLLKNLVRFTASKTGFKPKMLAFKRVDRQVDDDVLAVLAEGNTEVMYHCSTLAKTVVDDAVHSVYVFELDKFVSEYISKY